MPVDSKALRRYHAGIERALGLFDTTNEWADYIAFLSRLLKSLQEPPADIGNDIPLKTTISRDLAQCLKPSLPSGVHQKALDVYSLIFAIIGQRGLEQDLSLYLPGLSHTLAFASLSIKPQLLSLYDDHILALPARTLRPAIRALILSLLPGIEEENSEDFDRTLNTFNRLRGKFSEDHHEEIFWQNLFLASITSPGRRAGVLVYLTQSLPKLTDDVPDSSDELVTSLAVTKPEPGLLVRCFATGLQDEQALLQRGFLDLLVTHFPLNAFVFASGAHAIDLDVLVSAAITVVLRRDMGLNRRLWTWFTGYDIKALTAQNKDQVPEHSIISPTVQQAHKNAFEYFSEHGLRPLVRSILGMISSHTDEPSSWARPFRVALSLMDRSEIGGPVVKETFVSLMKHLQVYQSGAPSQEAFTEVFRSAGTFFDGIESKLLASQLLNLIQQQELELVLFVVVNFNLEEEELMSKHIPLLCNYLVDLLESIPYEPGVGFSSDDEAALAKKLSQLLDELLLLIPDDVSHPKSSNLLDNGDHHLAPRTFSFYAEQIGGSKSIPSISLQATKSRLLQKLSAIFITYSSSATTDLELLQQTGSSMNRCIGLVKESIHLIKSDYILKLLDQIRDTLLEETIRFQLVVILAKLVTSLRQRDTHLQNSTSEMLCTCVPRLVSELWRFLLSATSQYHVEAVENIWRLHSLAPDLCLVRSTILSFITDGNPKAIVADFQIQRISVLWTHSKSVSKQLGIATQATPARGMEIAFDILEQPILHILDTSDAILFTDPGSAWLRSLVSLGPFFGLILDKAVANTNDPQILSLEIQRLSKLIRFAKSSDSQWRSFTDKAGPSSAIMDLCSSLISKEASIGMVAIEALAIVRLIVSDGNVNPGDDIIRLLTVQLSTTYVKSEFQDLLLDTLQSIFSNQAASNFSEYLLPVLLQGIASPLTDLQIDKWVTLLCNVVPLLSPSLLMTNLLKITSRLCKRVELYFDLLQRSYGGITNPARPDEKVESFPTSHPERSITNLMSGMEYVLARAHRQVSAPTEPSSPRPNGSAYDRPGSRSVANDHLTVILCMQDVLKTGSAIWLWRSSSRTSYGMVDPKSFHYLSTKLRTRSRRILENLIEAEPQECLETLMGLWVERRTQGSQHGQILELLQTLDGARPKFMMPATFNAIYNRTNPSALDQTQKSSLSVNVNAFELIAFLNDYTNALEDDLLEEIWTDCTTFLKEILANPMPHRSILFKLLEFIAVLCQKMEKTNFGEESRMRKELADICARLFTAIFTIKPSGFDSVGSKVADIDTIFKKRKSTIKIQVQPTNALQTLQDVLPHLSMVLSQSDRLVTVYTGIAVNITGPLLHSKSFPQTVSPELLALLQVMSTSPAAVKAWKKDVLDAFNDSKFFQNETQLVEPGWLPLLRQAVLTDKTLMPELLTRIIPPAAAGLMFGVGATAARTDADRRTQLILRRIALLLLCIETDSFIPNLQVLLVKLGELLTATPESSPSSSIRNEIHLVLRTILLTFTHSQLASVWPLIDTELQALCLSMIKSSPAEGDDAFTPAARLQASKLLDLLLILKPDEFQLHEWLFITDTVDAIYPDPDISFGVEAHNDASPYFQAIALADQIGASNPLNGHNRVSSHSHSRSLSQSFDARASASSLTSNTPAAMKRLKKPYLCTDESRRPEKIKSLLANFFSQLSIRAFEDNYGLMKLDLQACRDDVLRDLFVDNTV